MKIRNNHFLSTSLLSLLLVLGTSFFPRITHAQFGGIVHDPLHAVISAVTAGATGGLNLKEYALDPLAYIVKTVALQSVTKSVVNWINSGFDGSPAFVQDLTAELQKVGDTEATRLVDEFSSRSELANLPWKDDIAQAVLSEYFISTSKDGFYLQNPYTLDQYSSDPKAFVNNGDYSKGGLQAFGALIFGGAGNNPLLLHDAFREKLNNDVSGQQSVRDKEITNGNGYLSFRGKCPQKSSIPSNAISLSATPTTPTSLSLTNTDNCLGAPILTPGALIAQSANKYLVDNGLEQYIAADEIGEVVNALMGQLVNNVLGGGGLAGVSNPSSGGGKSYVDQLGSASPSSNSLSTLFSTTITKQIADLTTFKNNWQTISDVASSAKTARPTASCIDKVNALIAQAGTEIASAVSSISQLQKIQSDLASALAVSNSTQATTVTQITEQYQTLQGSGQLPSASDLTYAQTESVARSANTSTGADASLYTQMTTLRDTGTCL